MTTETCTSPHLTGLGLCGMEVWKFIGAICAMKSASVQMMAWLRICDKPLSEQMTAWPSLLTHSASIKLYVILTPNLMKYRVLFHTVRDPGPENALREYFGNKRPCNIITQSFSPEYSPKHPVAHSWGVRRTSWGLNILHVYCHAICCSVIHWTALYDVRVYVSVCVLICAQSCQTQQRKHDH